MPDHIDLSSFPDPMRVLIIGARGGIGGSLYAALKDHPRVETLVGTSRRGEAGLIGLDLLHEGQISDAANRVREAGPFHLIVNATGFLHGSGILPEKKIDDLNQEALQAFFAINTIAPALLYKYFLPLLSREGKAVMAHLSARVGSISDNHIGGWYGYRAAKAAQNMITKTASIEARRKYKNAILLGLHPGTVDTELSAPFQGAVKSDKLFTANVAALHLLTQINHAELAQSGLCLAWDGAPIPF